MTTLRNNWVAFLFIATLAFFAWDGHNRAAQNTRTSIQRSVDTCRRSNPGRAYLRLRAKEFTKTDLPVKQSYTTKISPQVFAILDCRDSVAQGVPVALPPAVQAQYLRDFGHRWVDVTRGPRIVGRVSFKKYFGSGVKHP